MVNNCFYIHFPFLIALALIFRFIFITRCLTTFQETRLRQPSHNGKKYGRVTSIEEDFAVILLRNNGNLEI